MEIKEASISPRVEDGSANPATIFLQGLPGKKRRERGMEKQQPEPKEEKIQSLQEAMDINTLPLLENSSHPTFLHMSTENTPF